VTTDLTLMRRYEPPCMSPGLLLLFWLPGQIAVPPAEATRSM